MKIAFVGKGGSGKTTLAALFARQLAAPGPRRRCSPSTPTSTSTWPPHSARARTRRCCCPRWATISREIKEYLRGTNPRIASAAAMVKTTPPGRGSRLLRVDGANPVYDALVREVGGVRLAVTGPFASEDLGVACYHSKVGAVELLLNHLVDGAGEYVVVDMTAGADSFASGLFTRFDATFLVCEPTLRSVGVYRQYVGYARDFGVRVHVVGNKVDDPSDVDFLRAHVGDDLLTWLGRSAYVQGRASGGACAHRGARAGQPRGPGHDPCSRRRLREGLGRVRPPGRRVPPAQRGRLGQRPGRRRPRRPDRPRVRPRTAAAVRPMRRSTCLSTYPPPCWSAPKPASVDDAEFVDCVRTRCPTPGRWSRRRRAGAADAADFADHAMPPPSEAERGQLLRALASDAIRGGLERHFGVKLAFQNCHRVAAFRPEAVGGDAYRQFVSPLAPDPQPVAGAARLLGPLIHDAMSWPRRTMRDRRRGCVPVTHVTSTGDDHRFEHASHRPRRRGRARHGRSPPCSSPRPPARPTRRPVTGFGSNPGNLAMYAYRPTGCPPAPRGRAPARLHAERDRLLRQLRLAHVRRPVGLRPRRRRADARPTTPAAASTCSSRRHRAAGRARRCRSGRWSAHAVSALRPGPGPGLRHRAVRRRRDDRGHARHLPGRVRRRRGHGRAAVPVRDQRGHRVLLHEPGRRPDARAVGRPRARRVLRLPGPGPRVAIWHGTSDTTVVPRNATETARPVDQRARRVPDADRRPGRCPAAPRWRRTARRRAGLPGRRHGPRHAGRPRQRGRPVRHRRHATSSTRSARPTTTPSTSD